VPPLVKSNGFSTTKRNNIIYAPSASKKGVYMDRAGIITHLIWGLTGLIILPSRTLRVSMTGNQGIEAEMLDQTSS
jgi:hypothetical protein